MPRDTYALVGIHPLAGTDEHPSTLHGVYVGFTNYRPSVIPESAIAFATHEKAEALAEALKTGYGVSFLCDCSTKEEAPMAELEKELLYPATKKTVRQVMTDYADILDHIYRTRTAGDFTWKGILHDFMAEIASTEDE